MPSGTPTKNFAAHNRVAPHPDQNVDDIASREQRETGTSVLVQVREITDGDVRPVG